MSERTVVWMDWRTGHVYEQTAQTSANSFTERVEGLIAHTREVIAEEPIASFAAVLCDGCGRRVELERNELPAGWEANAQHGDLCPRCQ